MKFGDIYYADLSPVIGSKQGVMRPVLILQDISPKDQQRVLCASISTKPSKETDIHISLNECKEITEGSYVLMEQIRNIDKQRLKEKIDEIPQEYIREIKEKITRSLE